MMKGSGGSIGSAFQAAPPQLSIMPAHLGLDSGANWRYLANATIVWYLSNASVNLALGHQCLVYSSILGLFIACFAMR